MAAEVLSGSRLTGSASRRSRSPVAVADEKELLRRYVKTREESVKEELVHRFLPLARSLALRYAGSAEPSDDLVQVASLGLVKALDSYRPERGSSFVAYAAPTILGELRRHFRDRVWELRLPRNLGERVLKVEEAARRLTDEHGRSPTPRQIAEHLELTEEDVAEALQAAEARRTLSVDAPQSRDPESAPMIDALGGSEGGYDDVEAQFAASTADLDDHEKLVLWLRFERNLTQYEIGEQIGVSQMQVSRIMRRGLRKLLAAVQGEDQVEPPWAIS